MKTIPDEPLRVNHGAWNDEMNRTHGGRGLTKREYFAVMAMQGLLSRNHNEGRMAYQHTSVSYEAVQQADYLIQRLNQPKEKGE